jgi:hypothetical protein
VPWSRPTSPQNQPHNIKGYAIMSIHHRSHGPGLVHAGHGGKCAGGRSGAAELHWKFAGAPYIVA